MEVDTGTAAMILTAETDMAAMAGIIMGDIILAGMAEDAVVKIPLFRWTGICEIISV